MLDEPNLQVENKLVQLKRATDIPQLECKLTDMKEDTCYINFIKLQVIVVIFIIYSLRTSTERNSERSIFTWKQRQHDDD